MSDIDWSKLKIIDQREVAEFKRLGGGGNNQVFRLKLTSGETQVLKYYFSHPSDSRDRLAAEYKAFSFLNKHEVPCVPQAFASQRNPDCALYSYIEGAAGMPKWLSMADLDQALSFIGRLKSLSTQTEAKAFMPASEACFSKAEVSENLHQRVNLLLAVSATENPLALQLESFLNEKYLPALDRYLAGLSLDSQEALAQEKRILSPSDFGFHNAILSEPGVWVFQDFEYFGWDDPVKLASDFMIHPAMNLDCTLRDYWLKEIRDIFSDDQDFVTRFRELFPLFVLKWCCILLNEFVPAIRERRGFAALQEQDLEVVQQKQLKKADTMLGNLNDLSLASAQG